MIQSVYDRDNRRTVIRGHIDDLDLMAAFNPRDLVLSLHAELVKRIADRVMERVGPALDKALDELPRREG